MYIHTSTIKCAKGEKSLMALLPSPSLFLSLTPGLPMLLIKYLRARETEDAVIFTLTLCSWLLWWSLLTAWLKTA